MGVVNMPIQNKDGKFIEYSINFLNFLEAFKYFYFEKNEDALAKLTEFYVKQIYEKE